MCTALPATARRMVLLEAVKQNRCHCVRSMYSASSVTDMARSRGAGAPAAAWIVPVGPHRRHARATSARSSHDVRRWLGSPCEEAMLLSTHMACCASVTSLDSSAAAQWRSSYWMRGPSMSAPEKQTEFCAALRLPPPPVLSSCSMLGQHHLVVWTCQPGTGFWDDKPPRWTPRPQCHPPKQS